MSVSEQQQTLEVDAASAARLAEPGPAEPGSVASVPAHRARRSRGSLAWLGRRSLGTPSVRPIRESAGLPWVRARERRYRWSLASCDAAVTAVVLGIALGGGATAASWPLLALLPVAAVVYAKLTGLYDRDDLRIHKTTLEEAPRLLAMTTMVLFGFVVVERILDPNVALASGTRLLVAMAALFVVLVLSRGAARQALGRWCGVERCLVLGQTAAASDIARRVAGRNCIEIVGHHPIEAATVSRESLELLVRQQQIDRLILVASHAMSADVLHEGIRRSKQSGARVSVLPTTGILTGQTGEVDNLAGTVLLGVRRFRPTTSTHALKRALDLSVSITVLVLFAPVLAVLALAIVLDSEGGFLYRQTRIGRDGRPFSLLKLRSMVVDADARRDEVMARNEAGPGMFKLREDPRITRTGALLRRTHLDELPQFVNVLRGDMSLVGPRPLIPEEDRLINGLDRLRLDLTPGITGPWQILGSGDRRVPMDDMLKLDYVYVTDWSLWSDILILVRTVRIVLERGGQ